MCLFLFLVVLEREIIPHGDETLEKRDNDDKGGNNNKGNDSVTTSKKNDKMEIE